MNINKQECRKTKDMKRERRLNGEIKAIAFDADDTLWVNEPFFRDTEQEFLKLISDYTDKDKTFDKLYATEVNNISKYGYGIKGFILSMIETALEVTNNQIPGEAINKIINLGKEMINKPVDLIDGIESVLKQLQGQYTLIIATKGDLLDQERKLKKSALEKYFHHIEVMSDKTEINYQRLLKNLGIEAKNFLMVGNSVKSDIMPVINIGGQAIHVPFYTTWSHEEITDAPEDKFITINKVSEMLQLL